MARNALAPGRDLGQGRHHFALFSQAAERVELCQLGELPDGGGARPEPSIDWTPSTTEGDYRGPILSFRGIDDAACHRLRNDDPRYYLDYTG